MAPFLFLQHFLLVLFIFCYLQSKSLIKNMDTIKKLQKLINENLTSAERAQIMAIQDPNVKMSLMNYLIGARKQGQQLTIQQAAQGLYDNMPQFKTPEVQKIAKSTVIAPPEEMFRQSSPGFRAATQGRPGVTPPPQSIMNPVRPQASVQQRPVVNPAMTGQSSFQQQLAARKQRDARMAQQGLKKESKNLQEFNMSMIGGAVKNVLNVISKMKPEELIAIANFVNSLLQASGGGRSSSTSTSSTSFGESKKSIKEVRVNTPYEFSPEEIAQLKMMIGGEEDMSPMHMLNKAQNQVSPPSVAQMRGKAPYPMMKHNPEEMKKMMKQGGMKENMKNKYQKVLKENIVEQIKVRNLTEHYLNEGPMASVWQGIKQAGSSVMDKLGKGLGKDTQNVGVGENTKKLGQELTQMIGKVNQMRHKFNSSILKNSEAVSQYHDLVQNLWQAYNQNLNVLGPFASQLQRQVQDAVGNFHYDLTSEKEQIDSFLNSLKSVKAGGSASAGYDPSYLKGAEELGKGARASAQEKRKAEADAAQRMSSSSTKGGPGGGHKALATLQANTAGAKEEIKKRISTASTPAEKQAAIRDLEKLFIKTSKQNTKSKDD